jgi:branched-chain amino acid transport system permease protein
VSHTDVSHNQAASAEAAPGRAAAPRAQEVIASARRAWLTYLVGMALAFLPFLVFVNDAHWLNIIAFTYLMAGLAASWNIIGGFGGQFSLGHGVFFAIGAYTTAIFVTRWAVSPWLTMIPTAIFAGCVAMLISWPTFRLRGPFFAIATLAFNEVAFVLANHAESLTGGPRGLSIPFKAGLANMIFRDRWAYALLMFAFVALVIAISVWLRRTRLGYYLLAVREDEDAARAAGINVTAVKLKGMALSAGLTAIGGTLFTMYLRYIDPPTLFTLPEVGVKFALLALIGGIGTIWGPLFGAGLIIPFENWLRSAYADSLPGLSLAILGLLMVLAALFMKRGVMGLVEDLLKRWRGRRA